MAIKSLRKVRANRKIELDITGPDGNAYALLGYAGRFAKQLGKDPKPILDKMQSSDYENLLKVFDEEFGDFVDLLLTEMKERIVKCHVLRAVV